MKLPMVMGAAILTFCLTVEAEARGCGSRGGPGVRGANGRCLSWAEVGGRPSVVRSAPVRRVDPPSLPAPEPRRPLSLMAPAVPVVAGTGAGGALAGPASGATARAVDLEDLMRLWRAATPAVRAEFLRRLTP